MDNDNFCYRRDNCPQVNQGKQMVGKDNNAAGFNDQSNNVPQSASATTQTSTQAPTPTHQKPVNSVSTLSLHYA
jgi:hypothetical protein